MVLTTAMFFSQYLYEMACSGNEIHSPAMTLDIVYVTLVYFFLFVFLCVFFAKIRKVITILLLTFFSLFYNVVWSMKFLT